MVLDKDLQEYYGNNTMTKIMEQLEKNRMKMFFFSIKFYFKCNNF